MELPACCLLSGLSHQRCELIAVSTILMLQQVVQKSSTKFNFDSKYAGLASNGIQGLTGGRCYDGNHFSVENKVSKLISSVFSNIKNI